MRLHDLRHSCPSCASGLRKGPPVIARLLSDVQAQTVARWSRLAGDTPGTPPYESPGVVERMTFRPGSGIARVQPNARRGARFRSEGESCGTPHGAAHATSTFKGGAEGNGLRGLRHRSGHSPAVAQRNNGCVSSGTAGGVPPAPRGSTVLPSAHTWQGNSCRVRFRTCIHRPHVACLRRSMPDDKRDVVTVCRTAAVTGRMILEGQCGVRGLTALQIAGMGLGASPAASGFAPGTLQDVAMTMDTARLVLVNSALQSTNEASRRGLFRMRRASEP